MPALLRSPGAAAGFTSSRFRNQRPNRRTWLSCKHKENVDEWQPSPLSRSLLLKTSIAGGLVAGFPQDLVLADPVPQNQSNQVQLKVSGKSELAVSVYPRFTYDAQGGGGVGTAEDAGNGVTRVKFDPSQFVIPPLDFRSTKILGLPIPPPLRISIQMQKLEGLVNRMSGEANIDFISKFYFTVGSLYAAAPLIVKANLTTDMDEGQLFSAQGKKLENGRGRASAECIRVCRVKNRQRNWHHALYASELMWHT